MNWNTIEGEWKQAQGRVRENWGKLTKDDLARIAGKRDQLVGTLQKLYGETADEIERQVENFERSYETL
jgi:uncharacterized protein YjbJ (UPF0337 family)